MKALSNNIQSEKYSSPLLLMAMFLLPLVETGTLSIVQAFPPTDHLSDDTRLVKEGDSSS